MFMPALVVTSVLIVTLVAMGIGGCSLIILDKKCAGHRHH